VRTPLPLAKPEIKQLAATLTPTRRPGDFAQAMMDLGSQICSPKRPSCLMCPLQQDCAANAHGDAEMLPIKLPKGERPVRKGVAFLVLREDGAVLLRQRAEAGLLGGMLEIPSTPWNDKCPARKETLKSAPVSAEWWPVPGEVVHVFTHFRLEMTIYRALVPEDASLTLWADPERCRWVHRRDLHIQALPSVMRKIIGHGLKDG
jgi:A/G-specific adenine glycosylase